ncbi:hypothetical protein [Methylococcus sp. Mc7]|uniref:hypothetical protein n=1 Tax=Methylococcus sp. Mc7 TaxID=2860258 RepID=UPI001C52D9E5|nr:hypothetical protein [Methylococcus sp. Mc7]QXP82689.1 hypothetical protein KW115_10665 [Methylococcus sp. Mc7]
MSEYQYYEFAAVDRPLTPQQQTELRSHSSRAAITATGFINEYHWGDLKGDPLAWVERYFDAHVYSANWGSCRLLLRLPRETFDEATLKEFTPPSPDGLDSAFSVHRTADHWILDWCFHDDSGELERFWTEADGPGWMIRLLPLRDELLRGDLRPLYLGWLAGVCNDEVDDTDVEPPVPPGLQSLTPAQAALVEFLLIDPDWLSAAAVASPNTEDSADSDGQADAWLSLQSPEDMRKTLRLLLAGAGQQAERELKGRFLAWQRSQQRPGQTYAERRTLARIAEGYDEARTARLDRERRAADALAARQREEREKYLRRLSEQADEIWASIDQTLQRGSGAAYDQALHAVRELADALALAGRPADFDLGLARLQASHGKRAAWVARLDKAGIGRGKA